jgi:PncC family amidohydrolase
MNITLLSKRLGTLLKKKHLTLAVAESCTGGLLGAAITEVPGSSAYFMGGVISYDNRIKSALLNVPAATLRKQGAVSQETVVAMARGAQKLMSVDCAVAVSGVAGPGGGTKKNPVGLVYIGIAVNNNVFTFECRFGGNRKEIREKTVETALKLAAALL